MCLLDNVEYDFTSETIKSLQIDSYTGKSIQYPNHIFLVNNYSQNKYKFVKIENKKIPKKNVYIKLTWLEISSLKIRPRTLKSRYRFFKNCQFNIKFDKTDECYWIKLV
jgi:hypothetical protein